MALASLSGGPPDTCRLGATEGVALEAMKAHLVAGGDRFGCLNPLREGRDTESRNVLVQAADKSRMRRRRRAEVFDKRSIELDVIGKDPCQLQQPGPADADPRRPLRPVRRAPKSSKASWMFSSHNRALKSQIVSTSDTASS